MYATYIHYYIVYVHPPFNESGYGPVVMGGNVILFFHGGVSLLTGIAHF